MKKLSKNAINDVEKQPLKVRVDVLYKFLVEGKSHRRIEREKEELIINDGWNSWKIVHFYGFENNNKGKHPKLSSQMILKQISDVNFKDFSEFHLENNFINKNTNDGKDILRLIKTRVGQSKLRKIVLLNYGNCCALCKIGINNLLVTSNIKPWADCNINERIDPKNAILLCKLHDGLFDNGLISFKDDLQVIFKNKQKLNNYGISTKLVFRTPKSDTPSKDYLEYHRKQNKFND